MLRRSGVIIFFLLFFLQCGLLSQTFVFHPHKFGINIFAGGIDTPRLQFVDIDGDGDSDLFILDRDEQLQFFRKTNGEYILERDQLFGLTVGSWFHFADIDGDGDEDCFTNLAGDNVSLFTNVGTKYSAQYTVSDSAVKDSINNKDVRSEPFSVPTFADIDADGDLDFFTGSQSGSVTFYENVGTAFQYKFKFITDQFDGINIQGPTLAKAMHGASGIEFFDADSNGTLDLFWGDYFNQSMYFLKNIGTPQHAHFALTDSTYPKEAVVTTFGFNIPRHVDVDEDGFIDLMVGSVFPTEGDNNFWFYKNAGTNAQPFYSLQTKNFLPMIDVGTRSTIAVADVDGDGDKDLVIGSGEGTVKIFINAGTALQASFSFIPASEFQTGDYFAAAASADLDGDAKPDLLVGGFSGGVKFYKNISSNGVIQFEKTAFSLDGITVGNSAAPCIADIDGDGTTDILIGNSGGTIHFYKNTGTNASPSYMLITTKFNSIDVGSDAIPFAADVDANGKTDLFIGNSEGRIFQYEFNPLTSQYDSISGSFQGINVKVNAGPAFADIDGDGDDDLFIGNGKGGIYFYENTTVNPVQHSSSLSTDFQLFQNYPNPFNPLTTISYQISKQSFVTLKVYDVLGEEVVTLVHAVQPPGMHSLQWNAEDFSSGIYFCILSAGNFVQAKKLVLLK